MGMTGKDIYDNFHQHAQGTGSWQDAQQAATQIAQDLPGQAVRIRRLQDEMEAVWTGDAADAAQRGVSPLALEHLNIADDLRATQDLMSRQAASFHQAANAVLPMPPEPTVQDPLAAIAAGQTLDPMLGQVMRYNTVAQHNVDVMTTYDGASRYNAATMPDAYGTLADSPVTLTLQPTPGTNAAGGSAASHGTGRSTGPGRATSTAAQPATSSESRLPTPSPSDVGAVTPVTGDSTTISGADGGSDGLTGAAVGMGSGGGVGGSGDSGRVAAEPRANDDTGSFMGWPGGRGAGHAVDARPAGPGGPDAPDAPGDGGQRRGGAGAAGGVAGAGPVEGGPAPRGARSDVGPRLSGGAATEQEAMAARPGEQSAGAAGLPVGGGRRDAEDDEHHREYPVVTDADAVFCGGLPKMAPEALGESPRQRQDRHAREAEGGH